MSMGGTSEHDVRSRFGSLTAPTDSPYGGGRFMKVLVLGSTGMLGHMACRTFSTHHEIFATSRSPLDDRNKTLLFLPKSACAGNIDCGDRKQLAKIFGDFRPDVVLNCIGIIKQKKEAQEAIVSIRVNSLFPHELAELASDHGAKVIFFSTDCVFSGRRGRYSEADNPDPIDLYGRSKLLGEVHQAPHMTIRCSIIGRELFGSDGLIEWFLSQRGKEIQGFVKAIYSGLTTRAMCQLLVELIEKRADLSGVWHIASEPISKFDLLGRLSEPLGLDIQIQENVTFECDRSLDSTQFTKETGFRIPTWEEMLADLVEDAKNYDSFRRQNAVP